VHFDPVSRGEGETERSSAIFALLNKSKVSDEILLRIESQGRLRARLQALCASEKGLVGHAAR